MKIAIFSDTYFPEVNGVAKTLKRYTDYLRQHNIEYRLYVPSNHQETAAFPDVERFTSIPFLLYPECRMAIPNLLRIKHSLDSFQPDLIHVATPFNMGLYGMHYGKKHQIPMVASYHTHFDQYLAYYHLPFLKQFVWRYMKWFHLSFDRVFVPSPSTKLSLEQEQVHEDIEIWGRGVDQNMFTPVKRSKEVRKRYGIKETSILLYVGRLAPEKDISTLLQTFRQLPEHVKKETHLLIVGNGPMYDDIKHTAVPQVTLTGFLSGEALAEVYASSDAFLFPSATETFGNVVLEALSSGLPVIGADAGGVKHLVQQGRTGFLSAPGDVSSFVAHTCRLLESETLQRRMSAEAREFALEQSWDDIFKKLLLSFAQAAKKKVRVSA